jgi:hypothetical protein
VLLDEAFCQRLGHSKISVPCIQLEKLWARSVIEFLTMVQVFRAYEFLTVNNQLLLKIRCYNYYGISHETLRLFNWK